MALGVKKPSISEATFFYVNRGISVCLKLDSVDSQHSAQDCYGLAAEPFGNWLMLSRIIR